MKHRQYNRQTQYFILVVQAYLKTHPEIISGLNIAFGSVICDRKKYGCKEERLLRISTYLEKLTDGPASAIKFDDAVCSMVLDLVYVSRDGKLELCFVDGSTLAAELRPRKKMD